MITTEILQILSSKEAYNYMLIPFNENSDTVSFYGSIENNYSSVEKELSVIMGKKIMIEKIESDDFNKMLNKYYQSRESGNSVATLSTISTGQNFLMELIEQAYSSYSSDIHFEPYEDRCRIRFRIDGKLVEKFIIDKPNYVSLVNQIKIVSNLDISEKRLPQDGRIFFHRDDMKFDVRVSSLPTIYGEKVVLRLLTRHEQLLNIENLGLTEKQHNDYIEGVRHPHGMVLITGPTGSGKSTTLYATLRLLNSINTNILTIEDPVEYTLEGVNQVQLKEEIGLTFGSVLRTFLRQDPDIIMLGEIRDIDTAQTAIRSALTGHLILSTIHTNSAWGSVSRLIDMGVHPYLISGTIVLCMAQRLIRLLCPHCKCFGEEYYIAIGCDRCYHTGYKGRRAIYEVIPIDDKLRNSIRNGEYDVSDYLSQQGVTTLADAAQQLLNEGLTTKEEVYSIMQY